MNAEYLWAQMAYTGWTPCIVLGIHNDGSTKFPYYSILFWDRIMEDYVERYVPATQVRGITQ